MIIPQTDPKEGDLITLVRETDLLRERGNLMTGGQDPRMTGGQGLLTVGGLGLPMTSVPDPRISGRILMIEERGLLVVTRGLEVEMTRGVFHLHPKLPQVKSSLIIHLNLI